MIQPPALPIRSLRHLYRHDFNMPKRMIEQLLSFPREQLIEGLQLILRDAIDNYEQHREEARSHKYWTQLHAPLHAIYFLGELGAAEALPIVEEFMAQDAERLQFWLHGDILTELIWEPLLRMAQPDFTRLFSFVHRDEAYIFARTAFVTAIEQHLYVTPDDKSKVVDFYRTTLRKHIDKLDELDPEAPGDEHLFMVTDIVLTTAQMGIHDLDDLIQETVDKEYLYAEEFDDVAAVHQWGEKAKGRDKLEIMSIYDRYQHAVDTWYKDYVVDEE